MPQWLIYVLVAALTLVVVLAGLGWLAWAICRWLDSRRDRPCQTARATVLARIAPGHVNESLGGEAASPDSGLPRRGSTAQASAPAIAATCPSTSRCSADWTPRSRFSRSEWRCSCSITADCICQSRFLNLKLSVTHPACINQPQSDPRALNDRPLEFQWHRRKWTSAVLRTWFALNTPTCSQGR